MSERHITLFRSLGLFAIFGVLCFVVYRPVLDYPYVQDDWRVLGKILPGGWPPQLAQFLPGDSLFFRPLGSLYFLVIGTLAGCNALPHHLFSLLLHTLTSLLVVTVVRGVGTDRWFALASGVIYLGAVGIHMDPLLWMVGFFDLAGAFFFFLSLLLFQRGKSVASAAAFFAGILCKESLAPLPALLAIASLMEESPGSPYRRAGRRVGPHLVALAAYGLLRIIVYVPSDRSGDPPYRLADSLWTILSNAGKYVMWGLESATPLIAAPHFAGIVGLTAILLLLIRGFSLRTGESGFRSATRRWKMGLFLASWFFIMLVPPLLLRDHHFRYYLLYAFVPLVVLLLFALVQIGRIFGLRAGGDGTTVLLFSLLTLLASAWHLSSLDAAAWAELPKEGTNRLIGKGSEVRLVRESIIRDRDRIPPGTVLLFQGLDPELFGGPIGPRCWLDDPSLQVFPASFARLSGAGVLIESSSGVSITLPPEGVRVYSAEMHGADFTGKILSLDASTLLHDQPPSLR